MFVGISSTFPLKALLSSLVLHTVLCPAPVPLIYKALHHGAGSKGGQAPGSHYRACADALPMVGHPDRPLSSSLLQCLHLWSHYCLLKPEALATCFHILFLDERGSDKEQSSANWSRTAVRLLEPEFFFGLRHLTLTISNIFLP